MFLDPPPYRLAPVKRVEFGPKWDREVTLGERKAMAVGTHRGHLEKLLFDRNVRVIEKLCANPRMTEEDILFITTRRPTEPEVLECIASSSWLARYAIRRALSLNPFNGTGMVLRLLPLLHAPHLEALQFVGDVHPIVRATAAELTKLRSLL